MRNLFLDTDILLDFLGDRKPFSKFAGQIFLGVHAGDFKVYTSGNSITTAYYILCKYMEEKQVRMALADLLEYVEVIPLSHSMLRSALMSGFADFEDAVQHQSAASIRNIGCIVTRNLRDYRKSSIRVVSPEELFGMI